MSEEEREVQALSLCEILAACCWILFFACSISKVCPRSALRIHRPDPAISNADSAGGFLPRLSSAGQSLMELVIFVGEKRDGQLQVMMTATADRFFLLVFSSCGLMKKCAPPAFFKQLGEYHNGTPNLTVLNQVDQRFLLIRNTPLQLREKQQ